LRYRFKFAVALYWRFRGQTVAQHKILFLAGFIYALPSISLSCQIYKLKGTQRTMPYGRQLGW